MYKYVVLYMRCQLCPFSCPVCLYLCFLAGLPACLLRWPTGLRLVSRRPGGEPGRGDLQASGSGGGGDTVALGGAWPCVGVACSPSGTQFGGGQAARCSVRLRRPAGVGAGGLKLPKQVGVHGAGSHLIMCSVRLSGGSLRRRRGLAKALVLGGWSLGPSGSASGAFWVRVFPGAWPQVLFAGGRGAPLPPLVRSTQPEVAGVGHRSRNTNRRTHPDHPVWVSWLEIPSRSVG